MKNNEDSSSILSVARGFVGNLDNEEDKKRLFDNNEKIIQTQKLINMCKNAPERVKVLQDRLAKLKKERDAIINKKHEPKDEDTKQEDTSDSEKDNNTTLNDAINKRKLNFEAVRNDFSKLKGEKSKSIKNINITRIWINENQDKVEITLKDKKGNEKTLVLGDKINKILNNRKDVFKETKMSERCADIAGSKFKGMLLKRKVSPVIVAFLGAIDADSNIDEYLNCINNKTDTRFDIIHDINNSSLSFRNKMLMKRYAKVEEKSVGAYVFKNMNKLKLLETINKKTIKNKPKKFDGQTRFARVVSKGLDAISNKFTEKMKIGDNVKKKLSNVTKKYKNKDLDDTTRVLDEPSVTRD